MGNDQALRQNRLVFYQKDLSRIDKILQEFVRLSAAKSILLIDKEGHMITRVGVQSTLDEDTISALVAGSFSATREMARLLGEREFTALFHQGERDNIQLSLVGDRTILTVLFDDTTTLGMIRLYVTEAVNKLQTLFLEIEKEREAGGVEEGSDLTAFSNSAQDTLDAFFED
jgi:predicted regulator of Ras-like GTPase activity (Roadblock/LC7/MglB family)